MKPQKLYQSVLRELNQPGLADHLIRIRKEQSTRDLQIISPTVITWESKKNDPNSFGLKPPAGSVTLYWAPKHSGLIRQLEYAHIAHDIKRLELLHERLTEDYTSRELITVEKATERMLDCPSFFDFCYGPKTLAGNLWLSDAECGSMIFAYNGGYLSTDDFAIMDYIKRGSSSPYEILVVISPPNLSKIEKAAVDAVPATHSAANIVAADICFSLCALVTIAVFVTINTAVTGCCGKFHDRLAEVSLPAPMLEKLGAVSSATELLDMRHQVFNEFAIL